MWALWLQSRIHVPNNEEFIPARDGGHPAPNLAQEFGPLLEQNSLGATCPEEGRLVWLWERLWGFHECWYTPSISTVTGPIILRCKSLPGSSSTDLMSSLRKKDLLILCGGVLSPLSPLGFLNAQDVHRMPVL